ncbi:MAG: putative assembly protein [Inoviridae sp.]|nr:MAG: putative assembly protein [Inoviridae sp.]
MANYSKFIKLLLSFVIAISPIVLINNANAANIGGWTMSNPIANGASTVYNGTKQVIIDGKDYIKKGTAKITPTATGVAKVLSRGVAGYALSVAVQQLIGAVDWVLDPANNRIKYYEEPTGDTAYPIVYTNVQIQEPVYTTGQAHSAAQAFLSRISNGTHRVTSCTLAANKMSIECKFAFYGNSNDLRSLAFIGVANPTYDPNAEREEKSIPLSTVAQQVISNAESGDTNAQVATTAAAADIVAEAEKDNVKARPITQQLESSSSTKPADEAAAAEANTATGTQTQNPTKPDTTDLKLEFPIFCNWAPTVCQAAQVVISFPQTLTNWWETGKEKAQSWASSISQAWTAAKEWATSEPSQDNTQVDVENNNTQEIDTQVSFSSQCPANIKLADFSYHGISQSWDVDFSKFCDVFATYLKPVVISIGAFSAVLIVSGVGVRENG